MGNRNFQKENSQNIFAALAALASAPTWEMTYEILKEQVKMLISDQTFAFLCEIISTHRSLHEIIEVENWYSYLGLLEDVRHRGGDELAVEEAWKAFMTLQYEATEAIEFFVGATQEEKRKFLVSDTKLLLSNPAFVYLRSRIEEARASNDADVVEVLEPHLHLLEDVRAHNINAAWTHWEQYM